MLKFDAVTYKPTTNRLVGMAETSMKAKRFFFSNNDLYLGVIGENEFILMDTRSGQHLVAQPFPLPVYDHLRAQLEIN